MIHLDVLVEPPPAAEGEQPAARAPNVFFYCDSPAEFAQLALAARAAGAASAQEFAHVLGRAALEAVGPGSYAIDIVTLPLSGNRAMSVGWHPTGPRPH